MELENDRNQRIFNNGGSIENARCRFHDCFSWKDRSDLGKDTWQKRWESGTDCEFVTVRSRIDTLRCTRFINFVFCFADFKF